MFPRQNIIMFRDSRKTFYNDFFNFTGKCPHSPSDLLYSYEDMFLKLYKIIVYIQFKDERL